MFRRTRIAFAAALVLLAAAAPTLAQPVYVANSSNGRIVVFDETGASSYFAGDTSSLVTPLGMALDLAGRLYVADNQRGRIVRYEPAGSGPSVVVSEVPRPDGLAFGPNGELYFVNSPDGATSSKLRNLYVLVGGLGPAVQIGTLSDSRLLRQTAVLPVGPYAGQVLVLSQKPAFIARYSRTGPTTYVREANFVGSLPGEPTGMAFTPTGDLLVTGLEGRIQRYDPSGNRLADFVTGLGTGPTRVAIGGDQTIYVSNKNRPALYRFAQDGTRLSDFVGNLQSPAGLAVPVLASTPVGQNVSVTPIPGVNLLFENVTQAGFTNAARFPLGEGERLTPCGNVIPAFAGLPAGNSGFEVIPIDTTALFTDTIAISVDHPDGGSRLFRASCPPDAVGFHDVTTLAIPGDPRGRVMTFSEYVVVRDLRGTGEVVQFKLADLQATVAPGSPAETYVDPATLAQIRFLVDGAAARIAAGNWPGAIDYLESLKAYVRANSGTTIPNAASAAGGNIAGALVADAATLVFSLSL